MRQLFRVFTIVVILALSGCKTMDQTMGQLSDLATTGYDLMASGYEKLKSQIATGADSSVAHTPDEQSPTTITSVDRNTVEGTLTAYDVMDGDTINLSGKMVLLYGIDAPELAQDCTYGRQVVQCGIIARNALIDFAAGKEITCLEKSINRYGRMIAQCFVDGIDISSMMVRSGLAVAFRDHGPDYLADEQFARTAKNGIWKSVFDRPKDWRAAHNMQ